MSKGRWETWRQGWDAAMLGGSDSAARDVRRGRIPNYRTRMMCNIKLSDRDMREGSTIAAGHCQASEPLAGRRWATLWSQSPAAGARPAGPGQCSRRVTSPSGPGPADLFGRNM
eukprot:765104-Hanusia_phi.AAC.9